MKHWKLLLFLIGLVVLSVFTGLTEIQIADLLQGSGQAYQVVLITRIPRTISLLFAGAMMSVCGLIMQQITQNKYVSPTTAGTMDSARLGILFVMLFLPNASLALRSFMAFLFSFAGTMIFLIITRILPQKNQLMLPLIGMMFGNIIGSVATFFAYQFQLVQNVSSWLQGNFATVTRGSYELIFLTIPLFLLLCYFAYQFTLIGLGESFAVNLGINYQKLQFIGIGIVALASAVILIMVGNIPFLGIIVPNLVRQYYGDQIHQTIGITALWGSIFLIVCDILARIVIAPFEVPVSMVVGIIGSALFIFLLVRRKTL